MWLENQHLFKKIALIDLIDKPYEANIYLAL